MITPAIVTGQDLARLSHWVADHIWPQKNRDFGNCQGMAVLNGDDLIAGMIWHNYEPEAGVVEISGASVSKRWLTRRVLHKLFNIPFVEWGCQSIIMRVANDDKPLHRMLLAVGFKRYVIPRLRGRDEPENIFVLTDDAWSANRFSKKELR